MKSVRFDSYIKEVGQSTFIVAEDGTGDCDTISEALAALKTQPGYIEIKEGTYSKESYPLNVYPFQTINAHGQDIVIIQPNNISSGSIFQLNPLIINGTSVNPMMHLSGFTIDGRNTTGNVNGIYELPSEGTYCRPSNISAFKDKCSIGFAMDGCRKIIERVKVWNMSGRGIWFVGKGNISFSYVEACQNGGSGIVLDDWNTHGTMYSSIALANGMNNIDGDNYGFYLNNAQAVMLTNCFGVLNQSHNFYAKALNTYSSDQLYMSGCIMEQSLTGDGIRIEGYVNSRIQGCFVANVNSTIGTAAYRFIDCLKMPIIGNNADYGFYFGMVIQNCIASNFTSNIIEDGVILPGGSAYYIDGGDYLNFDSNMGTPTFGVYPTNSYLSMNEAYDSNKGLTISVLGVNNIASSFTYRSDGNVVRSDGKKVLWG
jgi:hypothetical protein